MPFTGASDLLTQLRTQIAACASWTPGSAGVHYPGVDYASATFPCAIIAEDSRTSATYAAGANGLRGGTLSIRVYTDSASSIGATEVLGQAILEELLAQPAGIPFRSGSVGLAGESSDAIDAAGTPLNGIEITLEYGLDF